MSIEVIRGASLKPVASARLIETLSTRTDWAGRLFVGYPIIGTVDGPHRVDALWVSERGIVVFDLIEGREPGDYESRQDDTANKIDAQLRVHPALVRRRHLRVPIHTISFSPTSNGSISGTDEGVLAGPDTILAELDGLEWRDFEDDAYRNALSVLESVATIRRSGARRTFRSDDSRGAKLKRLEDSIATLDHEQSAAVIETVDGVQRIRGLAGSGKTIVLALKAAYLHAQYPEWRIGVTFNTRSLKGHFRRLIRDFHADKTGEAPDWQNLRIVNSWGAPGYPDRSGIYHEYCHRHGVDYLDFRSATSRFGGSDPFADACKQALDQTEVHQPIYDALLVDEAQDLPPAFLMLCHAFLKEPKRLVYAYDELQNLANESLPPPEDVFGRRDDGTPLVRLDDGGRDRPRPDIVLKRCYRNSKPVLVAAHALGFGIYRAAPQPGQTGLVQMFDHPLLWEEVGYVAEGGELKEGSQVRLVRPETTSPGFLAEHSPVDDLIHFRSFATEQEQAAWVAQDIRQNLQREELRHGDIVVINPDPRTTRGSAGIVRALLLDLDIQSHLAGVDTNPDTFYLDGESVTFSGVHRAKGNEAAMVYIINAHDCESAAFDLARIRNRLFTAMTRSKAWVRVLGIGPRMDALTREYEALKARNFSLDFRYPSAEERERLRVIHRDMTEAERKRVRDSNQELGRLVQDLEHGNVRAEDLDETTVDRLKALLEGKR